MDIISFNEAATANGRIENFIENPDSTSGILTVPKVIATGETVTIPAGRVAVLPNIQVDGTLVVDGEVFVPSGATTSDLQSQVNTNKADINTINTTSLPAKADRTFTIGGDGYAWVDETANRVAGTTYTNSAGKPIYISITTPTNDGFHIEIDGVAIGYAVYSTSNKNSASAIVPNGSIYKVIGAFAIWVELK